MHATTNSFCDDAGFCTTDGKTEVTTDGKTEVTTDGKTEVTTDAKTEEPRKPTPEMCDECKDIVQHVPLLCLRALAYDMAY